MVENDFPTSDGQNFKKYLAMVAEKWQFFFFAGVRLQQVSNHQMKVVENFNHFGGLKFSF